MKNYSTPRKMKRVGDLFEKYTKHIKAPQGSVKKECVVVIKEVTGFSIPFEQLDFVVSTKILYIKAPSIVKSELTFHHEKILTALVQKMGADVAPKKIL